MKLAEQDQGQQLRPDCSIAVSAAFEGSEEIAQARLMARSFLLELQDEHEVLVSCRAAGMIELAVSELVTNARKYAPGPSLLTFELSGDAVEITVWDTEPKMPVLRPPDPTRVGQHGLEIVLAVCQSFEVHREPVGKRIKVTVALADDQLGDAAGSAG
ncbi:anti-sigma regulatory factor (Ser/Thr protein kinase) [Streptomyces achromogenes]|uniref:ATP-binding protein n=1 Tax=Streptomyces achromogenes TaxID=67255 RepID=UPI002789FB17|nr:ATP-binding protein [Streptomyces achromogenes]MDQ0834486.1 anti-sigma regulatory factor (Ser/Thr protein kinase) [Streptomyces achromogenes]